MFTQPREEVLGAVGNMGALSCLYNAGATVETWLNGRCDCKYGYELDRSHRGSEQTGCPELRTLYGIVDKMTDFEWRVLTKRAGMLMTAELLDNAMKETLMQIDSSDALKILDSLRDNENFHRHRDLMNGAIHRASAIRFSPITSETISQRERLEALMREQGVEL